jgi:glutaminyl-peptide cyclotransferase
LDFANSFRRTLLRLGLCCALACSIVGSQVFAGEPNAAPRPLPENAMAAAPNDLPAFDGTAAYAFLETVCDFGPRPSLSVGMTKQREFLKKHFTALGAKMIEQPFNVREPNSGQLVQLTNLVVRWHPERKKRLLFCCHYDTRPFPDRDPVNPRGVFVGANDGGSGVAVLCELGKQIAEMEGPYGVDFVFFDGEEFVYIAKRDPMFLGSGYFAQQYATQKFDWKYQFGILLDMVGDKDLQIHYEGNSLGFAPRLTRSIWGVAQELGVKEFVAKERHKINDDHLPLNSVARIETCDIIDFDFPDLNSNNAYWHTEKDTVENCSAESLGKVGKVVLEWLRQMQRMNKKK